MKTAVRIVAGSWLVLISTGLAGQEAERTPYGVCAHVSRSSDHRLAEQEFLLMRAAGIRWARTDFDWTTVQQRESGPWDYTMFDETLRKAEAAGITILPILGYDVAWARPAYRHLDLWREYVRNMVSRYKGRLTYWEVWNEPDLEPFWKEKPDPANYTTLLKAAYEEIKAADPEAKVLLGGLSGIPFEFIDGIYKAGGKAYFDIMNVHPYRYPKTPEGASLKDDLAKLRQLMAQYGDGDKRMWITEIGWPTHRNNSQLLGDIVRAGLKAVNAPKTNWTLAVFDDPGYVIQVPLTDEALQNMLPGGGKVVRLKMADIERLTPEKYDALLLPLEEAFPADWFDVMERYVRDGGVLILGQGVPLYFTIKRGEDGRWVQGDAGESYRQRLHIGWEAWWTRQGVPKTIAQLNVPDELAGQIRITKDAPEATRFLTDAKLKPQDRFIPLLQAVEGDYVGTAAALFDLNSDMKGAVIVSSLQAEYRGVLEDQQALMLARAYLIALHSGVERMFWYNFRAFENNPLYNEDHFEIVHRDLSAKPAYRAMQAMNKARPAGSMVVGDVRQVGTVFMPGWKRPDGQMGWAVWIVGPAREMTLKVQGEIAEVFDVFGETISIQPTDGVIQFTVTERPVYIVGPKQIEP